MKLSSLYDLDSLLEIDSDESHIVIVDDKALNALVKSPKSTLSHLVSKPVSGEVYLITNAYFTRKLYILFIEQDNQQWVKVLQFIDMDNGNDTKYALTKGDYEVLKSYPVFKDDVDLAFFMAAQEYPLDRGLALNYNTDSQAVSVAMNNMNEYLKQGLWLTTIEVPVDPKHDSAKDLDISGITDFKKIKDTKDYESFYTGNYKNEPVILELHKSSDKSISFIVVGKYESLKDIYLRHYTSESNTVFGAGYFYSKEQVMPMLAEYNKLIKSNEITPEKMETTPETTPAAITEPVLEPSVKEEFWNDAEKQLTNALKEESVKKRKTRQKDFKVMAEISDSEKQVAAAEVTTEAPKKVSIQKKSKRSLAGEIALAQKESKIVLTASLTYPHDWDYVYSLKECSDRYNPTIGQRFNQGLKKWVPDETQIKGMTVEEWNAYFISHPEYAHLIDSIIGHIGGITLSEKELMESGHLLYNPNTKKLQYVHEYLRGNAYTLLEELEASKDAVQQLYGEDFYQNQISTIEKAMPTPKSILSPNPESVPFIHPLDEAVVKFEVNTAGNLTYPKQLNKKLMGATVNASKTNPNNIQDIESTAQELQSLSIVIFFLNWMDTQYGKLAGYNLPNTEIVDAVYFRGMSFSMFQREYLHYKLEYEHEPTESDFYEVRDNVKRFVNDLFQDFLKNEITEDDRTRIEHAWNKRYNGFIELNIWKYPIFIRHSKYLKDRTKAQIFEMTETQIEGIKFATINNGSIIAHEVGFGKTLVSIGYMSHMFETNQANNILTLVPKSLYVNNKWKEEVAGSYDTKRGRYLIGATPQYNLIEMGNFTPQSIFEAKKENEDRKYKTYSDAEIRLIKQYDNFLIEIGGDVSGKTKNRTPGSAMLPTSAYQYRMPVVSAKSSWTKIADALTTMDLPLFNRCGGPEKQEMTSLLNFFSTFDIGSNAKEKKENIAKLVDELNKISFYYKSWMPRYGNLPMDLTANPDESARSLMFFNKSTEPYAYERTQSGAIKRDGDGNKIPRPALKIAEDYVLMVLENIHTWLSGVLVKMHGYGIYEYGQWKFSQGQHNIILATRDSLRYLGFSTQNREDVQKIVSEITTYQHEVQYDEKKVSTVVYVNELGEKEVFKRAPEKVLQKQLDLLIGKIELLMTEAGSTGKFILNNLKIDGFILDEAHIAKKVFTNVKTESSVVLVNQEGTALKINTSSHDIRGAATPDQALRIFAICQYIRSLGDNKPIMLLSATPFSNQPTEIFSMLAVVGIKQLREQGISNIKNFFDLFLKETLKYDFDHKGEFIKRITVENFRNKVMLSNLIWSIIDIKREATLDKAQEAKTISLKPRRIVFPKLSVESSIENIEVGKNDIDDIGLKECEQYGKVNTVAIVNRLAVNTCSIVDRNAVQKQMMEDIEKVVTNAPNLNNPVIDEKTKKPAVDSYNKPIYHSYNFSDVCPNAALFTELEAAEQEERTKKGGSSTAIVKKDEDLGKIFKALGLSRAIALSPYLFNCNQLPEPTPENFVKYSPKIEFMVKAVESVKNYHVYEIPKKIKALEAAIELLNKKGKLNADEEKELSDNKNKLSQLTAALEVSGQVAYFNILRFNYYSKDASGKAQVKEYNIAELIKEYLVKKDIFKAEEIAIFSSDTSDSAKEDAIKGFQDGDVKFFIGTPAMREGVDLQHKASTMYVMTPDWNPTDMRQVEGRIWRRDNENGFVRIVYVLLDQSIEVFIYSKLEEKARRLQQIMKERNTIAELEEMSLDPNQTKVALASDPEKRADIITKLCEVVLSERRSKISRSREELKRLADKLDQIYESLETVKDTYLVPFYDEYPKIAGRIIAFKRKGYVETYMNDKPKFLSMFAADYVSSKIKDPALPMALELIHFGENRDRTINFARTYNMDSVMDILTGIKTMIENKELFLREHVKANFATAVDAFKNLVPAMLSQNAYETNQVYNFLLTSAYSDKKSSSYGLFEGADGIRLFEGMRILNMPEEVQQVILKAVSKLSVRAGSISRQNVLDAMDKLADQVVRMLTEYATTSPEVRPEAYRPYVTVGDYEINQVTVKEFDEADLFQKIQIVKDFNIIVRNRAMSAFRSLNADNRKKVVEGKLEYPTFGELIPILNLQDLPKVGEGDALEKLIAPINDMSSVMKDVKENFLVTRNLTINDLPSLVERFEADYTEINEKISALQVSREKLIEKFKLVEQERKAVTIDQIVGKFAETNSYLEFKIKY